MGARMRRTIMRRETSAASLSYVVAVLLWSAVILTTGAGSAWSDELGAWYGSDARASSYSTARGELSAIFQEARQQSVPGRLLLDRLREGAAKNVPPSVLTNGLRVELGRLERAHLIIDKARLSGSFLSGAQEVTLKEVCIFLRAGLPDKLIGELLAAGASVRGGRESALAACGAIMDLRAVAPVADADSLQIGRLLMISGMEPSGYGSLALVYDRGRSRGLSHDRLVREVIINTLTAGGGLSAMNQKIESTPIAEPIGPTPPPAAKHPALRAPGPREQRKK